MKKIKSYLWIVILSAIILTGCAGVMSPVSGYLITSVQGPITATSASAYSKKGSGSCVSVLGLFAFGNASINTIAKRAKITQIHHVDYSSFSLFGIFSEYRVYVYGE